MNERKERDDEIEEIKLTAGNTIRSLMDQNKLNNSGTKGFLP